MSRASKSSRLYQEFYRNGPSHRDGADVSFRDIVKMFGFKTATVGNWVNRDEQQRAANLFFDAFCDLMLILNVPEEVISLNNTLSIAFGKGGNKYSSAHYNTATRTLSLAKNAGGGALAHEWFHAFDHFIATRLFLNASDKDFASALWIENSTTHSHLLNQHLEQCFQRIFLQPNSQKLSVFFERSAKADKAMKTYYYAQPQEICARAFETFVQDSHFKNAFLVQGTKQSAEAKLGIYPQGLARNAIAQSFQQYFKYLGRAVDHKRDRSLKQKI